LTRRVRSQETAGKKPERVFTSVIVRARLAASYRGGATLRTTARARTGS